MIPSNKLISLVERVLCGCFVAVCVLTADRNTSVATPPLANPTAAETPQDPRRAVEVLATLCDRIAVDPVDAQLNLFRNYSKQPHGEIGGKLSPLKRLEVAFLSAERARQGNGTIVLSHLVDQIARVDQDVQKHPLSQPYLNLSSTMAFGDLVGLKFSEWPQTSQDLARLGSVPTAERRVIEWLVNLYCAREAPGTTPQSVIEYFGAYLPRTMSAYDLMSQSVTTGATIRRGLGFVPAEKRPLVVDKIAVALAQAFGGAEQQPELERFLRPLEGSSRVRAFASLPPRRGKPPQREGSPAESAVGRYVAAERQLANQPRRRPFDERASAEARTCEIVMGSAVVAKGFKGLRPVRIGFEQGKAETGGLVLHFSDGTRRVMSPVWSEDVLPAFKMLYQPTTRKPSYARGEGIVLAACDFMPFEFGDDGAVVKRHANLRLHPALEDSQLGWALIDSAAQIGDGPSQLLAMIDAHCSKGALLAAQSFLKQLDIGIDGNGWAITDVPLEISANGERIHVRRAPGTSLDSDDLADSAFIEARVLTYPERLNPTERYTECLYRAIPTLTRASYDWSRLNRFACVFAVVRWACDNGAACDTDPAIPAAERLPTPDAIVVDRQSVLPNVPIGEQERIALVRAKMEAALGRIGRRIDTTTLKTVQDECDKSIALWRRVLAMYRDKIIAVNDDSKVPQRVWNEYLSLISESESKRLALARFDPLAQSWIKLSILKAEVLPPYLR